ncbi:MAG: FAD-dependent oxidoreductase [Pseudomonadota bacterium]
MIAIVGGGIVGLSIGYALSKRGVAVTVLEGATIASGASGVATSYLEPRLGHSPVRAVEWEGLKRWPALVRDLESETGRNLGLRREGQIRIALPGDEEKFERDLAERREQGWKVELLSQAKLAKREPALTSHISAAAHLPTVQWLNGRQACLAMADAIAASGGHVYENWSVRQIDPLEGSVRLTGPDGNRLNADKVILCSGMGMNEVLGLPDDVPENRAVRGVNLTFDMSGLSNPLIHLIKHNRGTLCPRGDRLIVGTTYEHGVTDTEPDETVVKKVIASAERVLPHLRDLPLLKKAAGIRTKVADGSLHLGRSASHPEVYYSLGHSGAGFLRAPVLAEQMAEFILSDETGEI